MNADKTNKQEEKIIPVTQSDDEIAAQEEEVGEDVSAEVSAEAQPCDKTESEIDQLKAKIAELEDQRLRAMAEFDNYKKRSARQYEDMVRYANEKVLCDLLEVVDNFERALKQDAERDGERTEEGKAFRDGIEMIYNQMVTLLSKYDVTPMESHGKQFDPNLHEALMQMASDEHPEGVVCLEVARGWKVGDRVLRHAKVGVSSGPQQESDDRSGDED